MSYCHVMKLRDILRQMVQAWQRGHGEGSSISHQVRYTLRKNPVLYLIRYGTLSEKKVCPVSHQVWYTLSEILSCISSGTVHTIRNPVLYLIRYGTLAEICPISHQVRYTLRQSCPVSRQVWYTLRKSVLYISSGMVHSGNPVLYLIRYGTLSVNLSCISHQV